MDTLDKKIEVYEFEIILSGLSLLRKLVDLGRFIEYYRKMKGKKPSKNVFIGVKFFVEFLIRRIYYGIELSIEDFELYRKIHFGKFHKSISEFTEDNPDILILKEINSYRREVLKSEEWKQLEGSLRGFFSKFGLKLNGKIMNNVKFSTKFSREDIEKYVSIYWLWLSGHNIRGSIISKYGGEQPIDRFAYTLDNRITKQRLINSLEGYAATLQYLWSELLEPELFEKANLQNLINVDNWHKIRKYMFVIRDKVIPQINAKIGSDL